MTPSTPIDRTGTAWEDPIDKRRKKALLARIRQWHGEHDHGGRLGPFHGEHDHGGRRFPFHGGLPRTIRLTGADVYWLFRGLSQEAPAFARYKSQFQGADVIYAQLQGAMLLEAQLQGADLIDAQLQGANLTGAAFDSSTKLRNTRLAAAHLADVQWGGAILSTIPWDDVQRLGDEPTAEREDSHPDPSRFWQRFRLPRLYPVEVEANKAQTEGRQGAVQRERRLRAVQLDRYQRAVRAYRQLATVLRAQGLHEHAARFAFRARVLQRRVLRCERRVRAHGLAMDRQSVVEDVLSRLPRAKYLALRATIARSTLRYLARWIATGIRFLWSWTPSFAVATVSGYGYRLWRSVATYLAFVFGFALIYTNILKASQNCPNWWNNWWDAVTYSVLAFHGRGVYSGASGCFDDAITKISAVEAVFGLLLEAIFIATFTQRIFRD